MLYIKGKAIMWEQIIWQIDNSSIKLPINQLKKLSRMYILRNVLKKPVEWDVINVLGMSLDSINNSKWNNESKPSNTKN